MQNEQEMARLGRLIKMQLDAETEEMVSALTGATRMLNYYRASSQQFLRLVELSNSVTPSRKISMSLELSETVSRLTSTLDLLKMLTYGLRDFVRTTNWMEQVPQDDDGQQMRLPGF